MMTYNDKAGTNGVELIVCIRKSKEDLRQKRQIQLKLSISACSFPLLFTPVRLMNSKKDLNRGRGGHGCGRRIVWRKWQTFLTSTFSIRI